MFNGLLLKKKRTFYSSKVSELVGDRRALFRLVGDLMGTSERQIVPTRPCLLSVADDFSTFFASKIAALRLSLDSASDVSLPSDCAATDQSFLHGRGEQDLLLNFKSVSQDAVARLILDSPTKSCPLDPIPTHLLKRVLPALLPSITSIVNMSIASGVFPETMKHAIVLPTIKKPSLDPETLGKYRPVSNLSFLSKLIVKVVSAQLMKHVEAHHILPDGQSAYRVNYSTETSLISLLDNLLLTADKDARASALLLLDLSAAFDTVDHPILLHRLSNSFGVGGSALRWFSDYLTGRSQCVRVGGTCLRRPPSHMVYLKDRCWVHPCSWSMSVPCRVRR